MAELCSKCFRLKHESFEAFGLPGIICREMEPDRFILSNDYHCGCCRCPAPPEMQLFGDGDGAPCVNLVPYNGNKIQIRSNP